MKKLIQKTIGEQISYMAKKYPDDVMVSYAELDYTRTWKQFNAECEQIARGFMALGLKKGSHIAIWATNLPCWLLTFFGSMKIGGICVSVNTGYKGYELDYQLGHSDADCLILIDGYRGTSYIDVISELIPELAISKRGKICSKKYPRLKTIIYAGDGECPTGMVPWDKLYSLGSSFPQSEYSAVSDSVNCHDIANIQYTSGTTGRPKGVMLTHHNILNNGLAIGDGMRFSKDDKLCIPVPFFHCFGLVLALMNCITHGTSFVPVITIEAENILDAIDKKGCTAVHGVPTTFIKMLQHHDLSSYSFDKIRTGIMAGSNCPEKVMRDVIAKMNMNEIVIVFGQTESSPGVTMTTWNEPSIKYRCNTVGKALSGVECKIIDISSGETLSTGNLGEFCARGNIMSGYYNDPEATTRAIDKDGWLHFGDLATCDEDGYYKIAGRIKDMLIRGGENVYPREIEEYLLGCPGVSDIQVVAAPSQKYGEEVCAVIIREDDSSITEKDVVIFGTGLSEFKIPSYVMFVDEYPMTSNGKVKKSDLREEVKKHRWHKTIIKLPPDNREWQLCYMDRG